LIQELQDRTEELAGLCRQYHVKWLDVFGSASVGNFDPQRSDLDFLVIFESLPPREHADAYFGLHAKLQELFRRDVDLVEWEAIKNPYFLAAVEESRSPIYGA